MSKKKSYSKKKHGRPFRDNLKIEGIAQGKMQNEQIG